MSKSEVRMLAEFSLPASLVGVIAAIAAGGLGALAGQPAGAAVITGLALGLPIALWGAGWAVLSALQKVPTGIFAPLALYWLVGFPLAMLCYEIATVWVFSGAPGLREPLWQLLAYNAMLSVGFAFGFMYAHEQFGRRWWPRVRDHNVYAYRTVEAHKATALALHERKESAKAVRARRKRQKWAEAHGA
jgi:hypothetical protein